MLSVFYLPSTRSGRNPAQLLDGVWCLLSFWSEYHWTTYYMLDQRSPRHSLMSSCVSTFIVSLWLPTSAACIVLLLSPCDFHRFLWQKDPSKPLKDRRMTRIDTFGVSASSFLANVWVNQNASLRYLLTAKVVDDSLYVNRVVKVHTWCDGMSES